MIFWNIMRIPFATGVVLLFGTTAYGKQNYKKKNCLV